MGGSHTWRFFRAGGVDQVRLDTGEDLLHLGELDQKLWSALACPVTGLEFDPKTLAILDSDGDGRIRAPEIAAAVVWTCGLLKDPGVLIAGASALPLNAINDTTREGAALLALAKRILRSLGKEGAQAISVNDTANTAKVFSDERFNGDGIVPPEAAGDDVTQQAIADIIACVGADTDRNGRPGVSSAKLDRFRTEAQAFSGWWAEGEAVRAAMNVGDGAAAAAAAVREVKAKVDDFFVRCRLAAFDPRAQSALNREEKDWLSLAAKDLSITTAELASFPIARIEPGRALPLSEGINPAWAAAIERLRADAVKPLVGDRAAITSDEWERVTAACAPYETWWTGKAGAPVERLGIARVRELLSESVRGGIAKLIESDLALEPEANAIAALDKLVRCHRDLCRLLNNFVAFRDFYGRKTPAIFQLGTLYLDSRACELCIRVEDVAQHVTMAGLSRTYLAYCDCTRKDGADGGKMTIVAAFTNGDSDHLMVGRHGVFYDRQGRDWDAMIVKIIENPISIRQAFWSPYTRLMRFIEEQIAKRAAASDDAAIQKTQVLVVKEAQAIETVVKPAPGAAPAAKPRFDVGTIAALGVAVGGITAAFGGILQAFFGLGIWMPLGLLGIILVVSGGSMVIAWLKLRQRSLGPILDACGWAVNTKALINIPFGASLTRLAKLPPGSHRDLTDPYAEKKGRTRFLLALLAVAVLAFFWWLGKLDGYLPSAARSVSVLGEMAPSWQPEPPRTPPPPRETPPK